MLECINCRKKFECEDFEIVYCCDGRFCGCMGLPIDPPLCDKCEVGDFKNDK